MATPIAGIVEIDESLNIKFDQHNEGLRHLEALSIGSAIDTTILTPPGSPTEGDIYIINGIGAAATAWDTLDFQVVQWISPSWVVYTPFVGLRIPVLATGTVWKYTGVIGQEWEEIRDRYLEKTIVLPYTLLKTDHGKELIATGTGVFNIPNTPINFPDYFTCLLTNDGAGTVTVQRADTTLTNLITEAGNQLLNVQGRTVTVRQRGATNVWKVDGQLA